MDTEVRYWTPTERESLRLLADGRQQIAPRAALAAAQHHADEAETLAEILEQSLVPAQPPTVDGVEIGISFRAGGVGVDVLGDFYDVITCSDGPGGRSSADSRTDSGTDSVTSSGSPERRLGR